MFDRYNIKKITITTVFISNSSGVVGIYLYKDFPINIISFRSVEC